MSEINNYQRLQCFLHSHSGVVDHHSKILPPQFEKMEHFPEGDTGLQNVSKWPQIWYLNH